MRFDTALIVALLPSMCLGAISYGPGLKSEKSQDTTTGTSKDTTAGGSQDDATKSQMGTSLMSTDNGKTGGGGGGGGKDFKHHNDHAGHPGGTNDCGTSDFNPITLPREEDKPSTQDCYKLRDIIAVGNHEWRVTAKKGREIARYKTCGFFARVDEGQDGVIGNGDIRDLVGDSADQYGKSGFVSTKGGYKMYVYSAGGGMACDNPKHTEGVAIPVSWNISKTNKVDDSQSAEEITGSKLATSGTEGSQGNNGKKTSSDDNDDNGKKSSTETTGNNGKKSSTETTGNNGKKSSAETNGNTGSTNGNTGSTSANAGKDNGGQR